MPELAEVETWRRLAEEHIVGKTILSVFAAKDDIVFDRDTPAKFARRLKGRKVRAVKRWGKHLWIELDQPPHAYFHFGMSGSFQVYGSEKERPDYLKAELSFSGGIRLGFRNVRRIGRVRLLEDPMNEPPLCNMGFDPFLDMPAFAAFKAELVKRKAPVKAVLLDQGFAAGVGNWLADEILYQAKIDPRRKANALSDAEVKRIRARMKAIVDKAVETDADETRFPKSWLFHHRWGKNQAAKTARGETIEFTTVGGRTTAWVPEVQG